MKIVFVCTGNTCRSPMAEGFLKAIAEKNGETAYEIYSRGICAAEGEGVSEFSEMSAKEMGVDISDHISTQLTADDISDADFIITMTNEQSAFLKYELKKYADKIFSVSEYAGTKDITDPYGGTLEFYKKCSEDIYKACEIIYNKISERNI